jgi:alkanesulfonate monooxygenase SsuD/methylene tetrahydromethanopterin reductase-like flavin-dependent oxidoreductase (luciferase family)
VRFALVGIHLREWPAQVESVQRAEELGFDAYWANDHPNRSMDPWTSLAALAMVTRKIRLLSLVSCVYYRSPIQLARCAADVDRLSGGRLVLGVGLGDDTREFDQFKIPFPPVRERQEVLQESLEIVRGLWYCAPFSYNGRHFQVAEARIAPPPVQQPHVPILIGGGGERVTLRQVARFADMSNFGPHQWSGAAYDLQDVRRKCDVLRQHCEALGRPYESVLRSHYTPLVVLAGTESALNHKRATIRIPDADLKSVPLFVTPAQAVVHFQALVDAGMRYFLVQVEGDDVETLRLLTEEVVPAVQQAA